MTGVSLTSYDEHGQYVFEDSLGRQHVLTDGQVFHYFFGDLTDADLELHFAREKVAKSDYPSLGQLIQQLSGVLPDDISGVVNGVTYKDDNA